jgi:hypothetical protein
MAQVTALYNTDGQINTRRGRGCHANTAWAGEGAELGVAGWEGAEAWSREMAAM